MSSFVARATVSLALMVLTGCASPPSVTPLMRVVEGALRAEALRVEGDIERLAEWHALQARTLRDGFEADLDARPTLDRQWVSEHVSVYTAAREALLRHQIEQATAAARRRANLETAAEAQRRAIGLIEQQDALLQRVPDLRRWMIEQQQENSR